MDKEDVQKAGAAIGIASIVAIGGLVSFVFDGKDPKTEGTLQVCVDGKNCVAYSETDYATLKAEAAALLDKPGGMTWQDLQAVTAIADAAIKERGGLSIKLDEQNTLKDELKDLLTQ
ncbi:MAG TPA: hypothetical protein PLS35_02225 [Nitrospira sp.]|nr:hypothetical protein [Nitrospira sp.]